MANVCFPKHTVEGKLLIDEVGLTEATRDWMEYDQQVRTPSEVKDKITREKGLSFYTSDQAVDKNSANENTTYGQILNYMMDQNLIDNTGFTKEPSQVTALAKELGITLKISFPGEVYHNGKKVTRPYVDSITKASDTAYYRSKDDLLQSPAALNSMLDQLPFSIDTANQQVTYANSVLRRLVEKLSLSTGINFTFITSDQAKDITNGRWNNEVAFFQGNQVYFVGEHLNPTIAFHEFSHPVIRALSVDNPVLFSKLYEALSLTNEGIALIAAVEGAYPELDSSTDRFKEETLVHAISERAGAIFSKQENTPEFKNLIDKILYHIKQYLRRIFGKIKIEKLSPTTTLDDMANMMVNENFALDKVPLTDEDITDYVRNLKAYVEARDVDGTIDPNTGAVLASTVQMRTHLQTIVDRYNSEVIIHGLQQAVDNDDMKHVMRLMENDLGVNRLELMQQDIGKYRSEILRAANEKITDLKHLDNATIELATAMLRLQEVVDSFTNEMELMKDRADVLLSKDVLTTSEARDLKSYLLRAKYMHDLVQYWSNYINDEKYGMMQYLFGHPRNSPWLNIAENLNTSFKRIEKLYNPIIVAGLKSLIHSTMMPMGKLIDERYLSRIQKAKDQGDDYSARKLQEEYDKHKLTSARIESMLRGNFKDANYLNNWLESYFYSGDDVVGGFTVWLTKHLSEVDTNAMNRYGNFLDAIQEGLKSIGYNANNLTQLLRTVAVIDEVGGTNAQGEFVLNKVWRFKSRHKGWQAEHDRLKYDLTQASKQAIDSGDNTLANEAREKLDQWEELYLFREYADEVYELEKLFLSPAGLEAKKRRDDIFTRMKRLNDSLEDEINYLEKITEREALWREYKLLCSLKNAKDQYKEGFEKEIAEVMQEYKQKSREYFQWTERPNKFQQKYQEYERLLADPTRPGGGLTATDPDPRVRAIFQQEMDKWLEANTVLAYTPEYYSAVKTKFDQIVEILSRAAGKSKEAKELGDLYKDLIDTLSAYRDEDGQPVGTEMGAATREKIKKLQEDINEMQKVMRSHLNKEDQHRLDYLEDLYDAKGYLLPDQEIEWEALVVKRSANDKTGLSGTDRAILAKLWQELRIIRGKVPTSYYLDIMSIWLNKTKITAITKFADPNAGQAGRATPLLMDIICNNPNLVKELIKEDKEENGDKAYFEEWFKENHLLVQRWDARTRRMKSIWERLPMWSVAKPKSNRHMVYTQIQNSDGEVVTIQGKPSIRFYQRDVKGLLTGEQKELRLLSNKAFAGPLSSDEASRKLTLEQMEAAGYKTPLILGKTVDIKGNFLPRGISDGGTSDKYINTEYENLQHGSLQDQNIYNLVETMKKHYLQSQVGADRYAQLYLDLPRFRKQGLENFTSIDDPEYGKKRNVFQQWWADIKSQFVDNPDDPNSGLNPKNLGDHIHLAAADGYDNPIDRMPVNGIYHMDIQDVSPDVLHGIARYMYGVERQKKLKEIHPIASALQDVLKHKANKPRDITDSLTRINKKNLKGMNIMSAITKKGTYVREEAIDHLIQREFFGVHNSGVFSDNKLVQGIVNTMFKGASMSYLAIQLPSAVTNMLAQVTQNIIEGVGGEHFNLKDLAIASGDASEGVAQMAFEIYKVGGHSLLVRMIEMFDAIPGRSLEGGGKFGTQASRTLGKDLVNLSWMYSPRKFMENYATLQAFFAMMRSTKIEQTINGQTNMISYKDAFEMRDGTLKLKEGIDKSYEIGGENFTLIKNRMKMIQYAMNGVYDKLGAGDSQRNLVFRMFSFLRKYFVTMLTSRWAPTRHNPGLMDVKTGYYVEAWKAFTRMIVGKGKYYNNMSKSEKAAFKKIFAELGIVVMIDLIMSSLFGWDPDDEDKYEKIRARSGALPLLGVAESEYPFEMGGWMTNHLLLQMMKVESQTQMWVPIPGWGLQDYTSMASMESAAVGPTVDLYQKIAGDFWNIIQGNEAAYYQHGVGPYEWQQKEQLKLWNHLGSIVGLRGALVEPSWPIKKEALIITRR